MPSITVRSNPSANKVTACRSCGAPIQWFRTVGGKAMPINAGAVPTVTQLSPAMDPVLVYDSADAHWATCPDAKEWRRKK